MPAKSVRVEKVQGIPHGAKLLVEDREDSPFVVLWIDDSKVSPTLTDAIVCRARDCSWADFAAWLKTCSWSP
ncbi:hypothetical protein SMICM17S_06111 [Streptomyces microflavus]